MAYCKTEYSVGEHEFKLVNIDGALRIPARAAKKAKQKIPTLKHRELIKRNSCVCAKPISCCLQLSGFATDMRRMYWISCPGGLHKRFASEHFFVCSAPYGKHTYTYTRSWLRNPQLLVIWAWIFGLFSHFYIKSTSAQEKVSLLSGVRVNILFYHKRMAERLWNTLRSYCVVYLGDLNFIMR